MPRPRWSTAPPCRPSMRSDASEPVPCAATDDDAPVPCLGALGGRRLACRLWRKPHRPTRGERVLYNAYMWQQRLTAPGRAASAWTAQALETLPAPLAGLAGTRRFRAACQVVASARPTHVRPDWGIDSVMVDGRVAEVDARPVISTPFANVLHFAKPEVTDQPQVLVVGPISGHFATLLRPTVRTLLADHDVYVIDWNNARDIPGRPAASGSTSTSTTSSRRCATSGPKPTCSPSASRPPSCWRPSPCSRLPATPRSRGVSRSSPAPSTRGSTRTGSTRWPRGVPVPVRTLPHDGGAGPVRRCWPARVSGCGTADGVHVDERPTAPERPRGPVSGIGCGRRADGDEDPRLLRRVRRRHGRHGGVLSGDAAAHLHGSRPAPGRVHLARRPGRPVRHPGDRAAHGRGRAGRRCSPGQTQAAHRLCTSIPPERKRHHLQEGVGHYGVFAGSRWESEIYPALRAFIEEHQAASQTDPSGASPRRRVVSGVG